MQKTEPHGSHSFYFLIIRKEALRTEENSLSCLAVADVRRTGDLAVEDVVEGVVVEPPDLHVVVEGDQLVEGPAGDLAGPCPAAGPVLVLAGHMCAGNQGLAISGQLAEGHPWRNLLDVLLPPC